MSDLDPTDEIAELLSPRFDRRRAEFRSPDPSSSRVPGVQLRSIAVTAIDVLQEAGGEPIDPATLAPLVQSIMAAGLVQPLLVRRDGHRYRLLAGRKRFAAARAASLTMVPCLIHDVDEAAADPVARAALVRAAEPPRLDVQVAAQVSEAVATIQSTAALLAGGGSPMAHRVALELLRAEAWRAAWQLRAAAILEDTYHWQFRSLPLGAALGRVRDRFASECRLNSIALELNVVDWNAAADLDEDAFVCGVTGAVLATAAQVADEIPQVAVAAHQSEGALVIEIRQHAVAPEPATASRFFDRTWTDRPGGWHATLGAAAARQVAERHRGAATFVGNEHGSTVRLTFAG